MIRSVSTIPEDFEQIDEKTFAEPERHQVSGEFRGLGLNAFQSNSSPVDDLPPPFYESLHQSSRPKRCADSKNSHCSYLSLLSENVSVPEQHLQKITSTKNILWQIHRRSGSDLSTRTLLWQFPQTVPGIQGSRIHILCRAIRYIRCSDSLQDLAIRSGENHTIDVVPAARTG